VVLIPAAAFFELRARGKLGLDAKSDAMKTRELFEKLGVIPAAVMALLIDPFLDQLLCFAAIWATL
jgi:hypothetical protein